MAPTMSKLNYIMKPETVEDECNPGVWDAGYSPPAGIPERHRAKPLGARRNSCEARPGLIESTHIAPLNEGLMAEDPHPSDHPSSHSPHSAATGMKSSAPRRPPRRAEKRRNSCEARPGLIESTHIAPLNEGLMAEDHDHDHEMSAATMGMGVGMGMGMGVKGMKAESPREAVMESFMRHSLR